MGAYPPPYGGVQTNIVAIRQYLLERGIPCAVINLTRHRESRAEQLYHPKSALEVMRLLIRLRYDIIHLHHGGDLTPRLLMLYFLCGVLPGKRTVLTFHSGGYPSSKAGRSARFATLRGLIFKRIDRIVAVNDEMISMFRRFGVPSARLRLIPPYTIRRPAPDWPLSDPLHGFFESHRPLLLTVGLLEPEYDLPLQIDVLGLIRQRHPKAGLVIIGSGSLDETLRAMVQTKPYAQHILVCGDMPHPETLCAIRDCDVFLRTTRYDGDAVSVREALHLGLPVIATENGMRPAGVLRIPVADLAALETAIEHCLNRDVKRQSRGGSGEENLQEVLELYQEVHNDGTPFAASVLESKG
ncbi:MAG: glycosyltransferase family 4 protein [Thermoguttaceae bacterium]